MSQKKWIPLEANPEVINPYIHSLGFPIGIYRFVDVMSCEDWAIDMLPKPVLGFLLLYRISDLSKQARHRRIESSQEGSAEIYYMKQTISNACGTIGLMHIIANCVYSENIPLEPGSFLETFLTETLELSPEQRGRHLESGESSDLIETAHKLAASSGQSRVPNENESVDLHFAAIIPKDWEIYELDGRAGRPILHGPYENFAKDACQRVILQEFFQIDPTDHHYTILALVPNESY